jgi:hypothetical protein
MVFEGAVSDFSKSVEKDGSSECVSSLPLIEAGRDAAPQDGILEPLEHVERSFHSANFARCKSETVLAGIRTKFAEDQRRRHGALLDESSQSKNLAELLSFSANE